MHLAAVCKSYSFSLLGRIDEFDEPSSYRCTKIDTKGATVRQCAPVCASVHAYISFRRAYNSTVSAFMFSDAVFHDFARNLKGGNLVGLQLLSID